MTYELVQFSPSTQRPLIRKSEAIAAAVAVGVGWLWSGSLGTAAGLGVVALVISCIVSASIINKSLYTAAIEDLMKRGHKTDFQIGNALIDSKSKAIAFVDLAAKTYDLYSAHDILGWEHQWIDKTDVATNAWGDNIRAKTRQASNVLVIKTSNPAKPLYKMPISSHRAGEEWTSRLSSIFNT